MNSSQTDNISGSTNHLSPHNFNFLKKMNHISTHHNSSTQLGQQQGGGNLTISFVPLLTETDSSDDEGNENDAKIESNSNYVESNSKNNENNNNGNVQMIFHVQPDSRASILDANKFSEYNKNENEITQESGAENSFSQQEKISSKLGHSNLWSPQMDLRLAEAIAKCGRDWKAIAKYVNCNVNKEQCRFRWRRVKKIASPSPPLRYF
jgi:hypothetical protein